MDAMTRHAVNLARGGDFSLLDAMELVARCKEDRRVTCLVHQKGCETLIGYNCDLSMLDAEGEAHPDDDDVECPFCDGEGDIEVLGKNSAYRFVSCPECEGHGLVSREPDDDIGWSSSERGSTVSYARLDGTPVVMDRHWVSWDPLRPQQAIEIIKDAGKHIAEAEAPR